MPVPGCGHRPFGGRALDYCVLRIWVRPSVGVLGVIGEGDRYRRLAGRHNVIWVAHRHLLPLARSETVAQGRISAQSIDERRRSRIDRQVVYSPGPDVIS